MRFVPLARLSGLPTVAGAGAPGRLSQCCEITSHARVYGGGGQCKPCSFQPQLLNLRKQKPGHPGERDKTVGRRCEGLEMEPSKIFGGGGGKTSGTPIFLAGMRLAPPRLTWLQRDFLQAARKLHIFAGELDGALVLKMDTAVCSPPPRRPSPTVLFPENGGKSRSPIEPYPTICKNQKNFEEFGRVAFKTRVAGNSWGHHDPGC